MLILAGVTINLTLGDNGIFTTATTAREKYKISEYLDKVELARVGVSVNNMGEVTLDNLINKIYEEKIVPSQAIKKLDEEQAKMTTKEGYVFIITADKIEYVGIGEQVETPPNLQEGDITFVLTPNDWTNKNIKVEISGNIEEQFTLQYSYDAVNWIDYTKAIEIEENKIIYACIRNALGEQGTYTSCAITKIDKLAPNRFTPTATSTTMTITVEANTMDQNATSTYGCSGIAGYRFSKDNGNTWTEYQTSGTYTFSELTHSTTYNIKVQTVDNAGNITTESISIKTKVPVAKIGTTYYESLGEAVLSSTTSTITLLADTVENITIEANKNITFDLNNKTLTGQISNTGTIYIRWWRYNKIRNLLACYME